MIYDLPPILNGTNEQNIADIRSYLIRLAQSLSETQQAVGDSSGVTMVKVGADGKKVITTAGEAKGAVDSANANAGELEELIVKSADEIIAYTNVQINNLQAYYLAKSDFGEFTENINTQIQTTARDTIESYGYTSAITSLQENMDLLQQYTTSINGEIRRGIVQDPDTGNNVLGIAISQSLQFTGQVQQGSDGYTYYELSPGQTFGLYTSTGWQFWIDGFKRGWYNSEDGMLHVSNVAADNTLQVGDAWQWINSNGLGLRYIGE